MTNHLFSTFIAIGAAKPLLDPTDYVITYKVSEISQVPGRLWGVTVHMFSRTIAPSATAALAAAFSLTVLSGMMASASPTYPPIPPGPIKLGVSNSLSGATAENGILAQKGLSIALANFDKANPHGIDGHKVELDSQNDQGNTTNAVDVAKQLVADHDAIVIKPADDPASQILQLETWQKSKLPVIGYNFGNDTYTNGEAWPYTFSTLASNKQEGEAAAKWLAAHPSYKRIAVLTDSDSAMEEFQSDILTPLKKLAPSDKVVSTATMTLGAVDVSPQVAQLKAANPDIVLIAVDFDFGPIWNAFQAASWYPPLLTSEDAYYSGYSSLGQLAATAVAPASDCIPGASSPIPSPVTQLMTAYVNGLGNISVNMLIFVNTDTMVLELADYAINKYHSTSPAAIRSALQSTHNTGFLGNYFKYTFTASNHFGLTGTIAAQTCHLSPLVKGSFNIPTIDG